MKSLLFLGILLFVLAACSSGQTVTTIEQKEVKEVTEEVMESPKETLEQIKADAISKNAPLEKLFIPINIKSGKVGDEVIFGTIFNKVNLQKGPFFARLNFIEGKDLTYSRIETNNVMVQGWTALETGNIDLTDKDNEFVPIKFKIGNEISQGVPTVPGTYQFEVRLYKRVDVSFDDDVRGATKQIYLKVE